MTSYYTQWYWITVPWCKCNRICGFTKMICWKAEPFVAQLNDHYIMASCISSATGWLHPVSGGRGLTMHTEHCAPSFLSKCPSRILAQVTGMHCDSLFSMTVKHEKNSVCEIRLAWKEQFVMFWTAGNWNWISRSLELASMTEKML